MIAARRDGMAISRFGYGHIPDFLALAAAEGWISSPWEMKFLLDTFPSGCLVYMSGGAPVAFVTSIKHAGSGWIGNLIVRPEFRGNGIGSALMRKASDALLQAGCRTVWLTASSAGRPIYERLDFVPIDTIARWAGKGSSGNISTGRSCNPDNILALDAVAWGDRRKALITALLGKAAVFDGSSGFIARQELDDCFQIGPWVSETAGAAAGLLDEALAGGDEEVMLLDVPEKNTEARSLLESRGFGRTGATDLMYRGEAPAYNPGILYSLASMGSMG